MKKWRVGSKAPLNVYDGDGRAVCQCHTAEDAARIVEAVNLVAWLERVGPATLATWRKHFEDGEGA